MSRVCASKEGQSVLTCTFDSAEMRSDADGGDNDANHALNTLLLPHVPGVGPVSELHTLTLRVECCFPCFRDEEEVNPENVCAQFLHRPAWCKSLCSL